MSTVNRYFRKDIPLIAPEGGSQLLLRKSSFSSIRQKSESENQRQTHMAFTSQDFDHLRGKREFAYHVMSLMVEKNYGDIQHALEQMVAVDAEWEHGPFLEEVDGEVKQVVPFSTKSSTFTDGFHSAPAQEVESKDDGPTKVAFEWRTSLY